MFSIISSCFKEPIKNNLNTEKRDLQLPTVHPSAVGLDWLATFVLSILFALSVTGVMPIGLTGSFVLLGLAALEASIPILSIAGVIHNLPKGYFLSFFMTEDIITGQ